jgi:hypothetical protein
VQVHCGVNSRGMSNFPCVSSSYFSSIGSLAIGWEMLQWSVPKVPEVPLYWS